MLKNNEKIKSAKSKFGIASIGLVSLACLLVVHAAPAAAQADPVGTPEREYDDGSGFYIRGRGFAILDLTPSIAELDETGLLDESREILDPSLSHNNASVLLDRETGIGFGAMVGYDFGSAFIGVGYDYSTQKFTADIITGGEINNNMALAELGVRFGGLVGFTLAAQYGLNFLTIEGINYNDGADVSFLQHNAIGKLALDVELFDFVTFGAFGKYYYSFAAENDENYTLGSSHTVTVGGAVSLTF